jgi:hypothetical protein
VILDTPAGMSLLRDMSSRLPLSSPTCADIGIGYSFAFTEDADLFEDARVELRIGGQRIDGQIVSISSGRIIIAVDEDMGETITRCILAIDNTALLDVLRERLEKAGGEGRALNTKLSFKGRSSLVNQAATGCTRRPVRLWGDNRSNRPIILGMTVHPVRNVPNRPDDGEVDTDRFMDVLAIPSVTAKSTPRGLLI